MVFSNEYLIHMQRRSQMKSSDGKPGSPLIELRGVNKAYISPGGEVKVLNNIDLTVKQGEFVAIIGKSGSGKSTLLNMITGIDRPSSGEVLVADTHVHLLPEGPLAAWRGRAIGVVFQFFQLLPTLTVAENIMLPMDFAGVCPVNKRRERALALLGRVGIIEQADKLPSSLSGGQQQRAAIARALANDPPLVVADEPTGNLDGHTAGDVVRLFSDLAGSGKTVIIVTHERDVTTFADRAIVLSDGSVETELKGARSLKTYDAQEAAHA
jgi:putative ABC transport system ATP-binding protein